MGQELKLEKGPEQEPASGTGPGKETDTGVINNFLLILYVGGEEAIYPGPGERTRIQ